MTELGWIVLSIFCMGYVLLVTEHITHIHKSATVLVLGAVMRLVVDVALPDQTDALNTAFIASGGNTFGLIIFLLCSMGLIEILSHYNFFSFIKQKVTDYKLPIRKQFWLIAGMTFFLSAILADLTVTIAMIQICKKMFRGHNLLVIGIAIVLMANIGGLRSPVGDTTTIMMRLANKFSASQIVSYTFLPALIGGVVASYVLSLSLDCCEDEDANCDCAPIPQTHVPFVFGKSEKTVITLCLLSFALPLVISRIGLPPYLGSLLGLGLVWLCIGFFRIAHPKQSHLNAHVEHMLQKTDLSTIVFFVGILMAVGVLEHVGVLSAFTQSIFGDNPSDSVMIFGSLLLGLFSSIFDTVPLTAIAIVSIETTPWLWSLMAITLGIGGCFLVIGSVSGVVAQGYLPQITFTKYIRYAWLPTLCAFIATVSTRYCMFIFWG